MFKIIGIGNAGNHMLELFQQRGIQNTELIACDTDEERLSMINVDHLIFLGEKLTAGKGTGSDSKIGQDAAEESIEEIRELFEGDTKMVFLLAGLGGGTGTGALSVFAREARKHGVLTIAIVTIPFKFEGKRRRALALDGIETFKDIVDAYIVIDNEKLRGAKGNVTLSEAYAQADAFCFETVKGISEMVSLPGYINVDFKDLRTVMKDAGLAKVGISRAAGENRALKAVETLFDSPFFINGEIVDSRYLLLNISSSTEREISMDEVSIITDYIQEEAGLKADLIWGNTIDAGLGDQLRITLIATGFEFYSSAKLVNEQIESIESIMLTRDKETLSLYFLEEEYSPDEIAEILSFLSDIYRNEGGDGLVIKGNDILEFDPVLSTILS